MARSHTVGFDSQRIFKKLEFWTLLLASSGVSFTLGCAGKERSSPTQAGGEASVGGNNSSGGAVASGGHSTVKQTGGAPATGGVLQFTGGAQPFATGGVGPAQSGGASSVATGTTTPNTGGVGVGGNPAATGGTQPNATGGFGAAQSGGAGGGGGKGATGGATAAGSAAGGTKATGGSTAAAGGSVTGGAKATGGTFAAVATGGTSADGGGNLTGPCDIYAAANPPTPCVAAYSTVRLLNSQYGGPLYQVRKGGSDAGSAIRDIGVIAGGIADSAAQDLFCGTDTCTVAVIYDQSGRGNHLKHAPPDCYMDTDNPPSNESDAKGRSLLVGGHKAYALYMIAGDGYRDNETTGMPIGTEAQGIYEVVDGTRFGKACCWDFGNGSTNNCSAGLGSMNALLFGTAYWGKGSGNGPWFLGDFEGGAWAGGSGASSTINPDNPTANYDYALGVLKTTATTYAIRVGNGQSGDFTTPYDGAIPFASWTMQGGIILGLGEDGSNSSLGTFFEGAITAGRPSDATDAAVLANVQAAKYGR